MRANRLGEPKPNQAVGALLLCPATGRALLQHRDRNSDSPLTWGTFGGGVDEGEQLKQALKRELQEECAFEGEMELIPLNKFTSDDKTFQYFTYIALVTEEFTPITNHETEGYKWFDVTNRSAYPSPLHPGLEELIDSEPHWDRIQECVDANYQQYEHPDDEQELTAQAIKMGTNISRDTWSRMQSEISNALTEDDTKVTELGMKGDIQMMALRGYHWQGIVLRNEKTRTIIGGLGISMVLRGMVDSVYLDPRCRGKGMGIAMYLGAVKAFGFLRSGTSLGIMAVKTWAKLAKYHDVELVNYQTNKPVPFKWGSGGIPVVNGQPMNKGMNMQESFIFQAKR